jgi:hypothetical protein
VAGGGRPKPMVVQVADEIPPELAAASWRQSVPTLPARGPKALDEEEAADTEFMTPNVEVTGRLRHGTWAARRNIDSERLVAQVPCRWRSG